MIKSVIFTAAFFIASLFTQNEPNLVFEKGKEGNLTSIRWQLSESFNCNAIVLERSLNGIDFNDLMYFDVSYNRESPISFEYEDSSENVNQCFYRIKRINEDGSEFIGEMKKNKKE